MFYTSASDRLGSQKGYPQSRWFKIAPLTKRALLFSRSSLLLWAPVLPVVELLCPYQHSRAAFWLPGPAACSALCCWGTAAPALPVQPSSITVSLQCFVLPSHRTEQDAHPALCQPCPVQPHAPAPPRNLGPRRGT